MFQVVHRHAKCVRSVERRSDQAGHAGRNGFIHHNPCVRKRILADGHGEDDERRVPVVDFLGVGEIKFQGEPVRNLAHDVAGRLDLAAGDLAESRFAPDGALPGLGKRASQRRGRPVSDDKDSAV